MIFFCTGNKMYHGNTSRYASPNAVDVTSDFLVPRNRNYFLDTLGNFVTFAYIPSSGEMEFEIQGPVNKTGRWISLGLSNNMYMVCNICFLLGRACSRFTYLIIIIM